MSWWSVLEIFVGALLASGFVIWMECVRRPKLNLSIGKSVNHPYPESANKPVKLIKARGLSLKNEKLPKCLRWMSRNAAVHCYGYITFYRNNGERVFSRLMPIKWSKMPRLEGHPGGTIVEHSLYEVSYIDVHPGEEERLDVVARFDHDPECYGWNNESYYSETKWRNKDWKLEGPEDYFAKVKVISAGLRFENVFKLHVGKDPDDFKLERTVKKDRDRILKIPEPVEENL